ncbi:MAG: chemotaxis protein CheD [Desulfobacteraceae bacterium]|uniref:Probable chemoreceptor glutamine deamidase CheD n=1 Tax=Candidatus Desulfaltia bathyphila TaxID=2841697 RepID=A0A8J6TBX5_9BACT|nr:chemotaxis protein CheD [Candidatus Desulfaltia bathyphila]MBL7195109.1 chemotaxis protein CheD [Desulfobacterales bacterium]
MKRFYNEKYKKNVIMLRSGEYFVSKNGEILYAVLGSCISVCLYDIEKKIGGMNHYLLPGMIHPDEILTSEVGRYGMYAMELLIGELIKHGARRENLAAKIFGGGNVLKFRRGDGDVTGSNIRFAKKFLELEGMPVKSEDLGGYSGRTIFFFTDTAKVLLKRFDAEKNQKILANERAYKSLVFHKRVAEPSDSVVLF